MDWLISLPIWGQLALLLLGLLPLAGVGAGVLLWAIDLLGSVGDRVTERIRGRDGSKATGSSADSGLGADPDTSPDTSPDSTADSRSGTGAE